MSALTLLDWAKRIDPNGRVATVVEMLGQTNEVLSDMRWNEGNLPTGHRTTVRTALPTVGFRQLNQGVTPTKSTTAQIDENCAIMEAMCEVDVDLAKLNGDVAAFRLSEARAFMEAMNQKMAYSLFYGNAGTDPEQFYGLAPRYNDTNGNTGENIIDAGGSGSDNASIWLVNWGNDTIHGIFPKGSQAGLVHEDLGEQLIQTATGIGTGRMKAYVDRWQWKCGIAVRDWRYAVRIANVDISALIADGPGSSVKLMEYMLKAIHRIPSMGMGTPVFYCNRTVREMLDIQAQNKSNVQIQVGQEEGRLKTTFRGIPIRTVDALTEAETRVTSSTVSYG
jgi:hypothetical protein